MMRSSTSKGVDTLSALTTMITSADHELLLHRVSSNIDIEERLWNSDELMVLSQYT